MGKKRSYRYQKDKTWDAFSKYIRLRDQIGGYCTCISCQKRGYWEKDGMQAGHLIGSRCNNILFDEELVHAQCAECNNNSGEQALFWRNLKERYGYDDKKFDEFNARKHVIKKFKQWELEDIEKYYNEKSADILAGLEISHDY